MRIAGSGHGAGSMLGGAPVTQDVANLFGADGYAESAGNAVQEGIKMISRLREYEKQKGD